MPIRSNIAIPQCPDRLPLANGSCVPGSANWNKLVDSQKFVNQAGYNIFECSSQRNNGQVRPVAGHFGNNFFENNGAPVAPEVTAEIQIMTTPVELLPGLNKGILVVQLKVAAIAPMNQQIIFKISRGAAVQTIQSFRGTTGTGFLTGIITMSSIGYANAIYTQAFPFDMTPIMPQANSTEWGAITIEVRKFNPRGNVTGAGASYFDGVLHAQVKQYKDCP